MADEPTLPILPLALADKPFSGGPPPQKRVKLHNTSPLVSSDPPCFSSDDDPSAENYSGVRGRQKRRFKGPWYSQKPEDSGERNAKRTLQRQLDSAVWLGSDSTEDDDDADFSACLQTPDLLNRPQRVVPVIGALKSRPTQTPRTDLSPEELAEKQICSYLEAGDADIDLSGRGLTYLSNAIIKPLSTIVSPPTDSQGVSYHSLRPKLKLFLASNLLRHVPGEIFNLDNVTVLSLRSNSLVDLPSGIGRLSRLVELNVANNNLHFLPYEILQIFSEQRELHSPTWHPNPFYEPDTAERDSYNRHGPYPPDLRDGVLSQSGRPGAVSPGQPGTSPKWDVKYKFRSEVRFMNIDGTLAKGPNFPGHESLFSSSPRQRNSSTSHHFGHSNLIALAPPGDVPEPQKFSHSLSGGRASKAPSLLEVALQTWSESPQLPELHEWLGYEPPLRLTRILADAKVLKETEADNRKCTICQRRFVIPRTEWLEWWQISKAQKGGQLDSAANLLRPIENRRDQVESMVPLIRRGCSWRCVPGEVPLDYYHGENRTNPGSEAGH